MPLRIWPTIPEIDAVLHLGDYIYEYAPKVYGDSTTGRFHVPPYEIVSLEDYRTRYAQYRLDKDFQRVHQMHPFITIWDDHEIANNSYNKGAQNHQWPKEGGYSKRAFAAKKAYYEWMPIRVKDDEPLYRKIAFGELLDVFMLDERLAGRTAPPESINADNYNNEKTHMLGPEQLQWLKDGLKKL